MKVEVRNGNIEQALRVFKRKVQKEGIIKLIKSKEHYEKPSEKRARKKKEGIKNTKKRMSKFALKPKKHSRKYL
tara:strand:+ start:809 stop:1030 length:222 start_codon:yes stop_codon:yes gene_type:complete